MNPPDTSLRGREIWPQEINKSHPKSEQKRCLKKTEHHSSQLTTCSLWVMMDKDFSRWDEIKIYMHCFLSQLVGRSSSFNSISAASDGHPESRLSNGAVSWQKPGRAVGTSGRSRRSRGWTMAPGQQPKLAAVQGSAPRPPAHSTALLGLFFFFSFYENQIFIASFNCSPLPFFTALIVPLEYGLETAHPCPSLCYLF